MVDEPLSAAYLAATGLDHPGRDDVIASQSTDPAIVLADLTGGPVPTPMQYQKHMTHHLLPAFPRQPLASLRHAFLVRDPERVLTSYLGLGVHRAHPPPGRVMSMCPLASTVAKPSAAWAVVAPPERVRDTYPDRGRHLLGRDRA